MSNMKLKSKKPLSVPINRIAISKDYDLVKTGISQSLIKTWTHCHREFALVSNGYYTRDREFTTNFGSCVHQILDWCNTSKTIPTDVSLNKLIDKYDKEFMQDTTLDDQIKENELAKAFGILKAYFEYYKDDYKNKDYYEVEEVFEVNLGYATIKGKIDGKFMQGNSKWLNEHKTKGMISEDNILNELNVNWQNLMYLLADWNLSGTLAKGVLYNVIRNPKSAPYKRGESLKDFSKRMYETAMENPDHYFKRWEAVYSKKDVLDFEQELKKQCESIKYWQDSNTPPPRSPHCLSPWPCQFLNACSQKTTKDLLTGKKLFPELEEPENADKKNSKKITKKISKKVVKNLKRKVAAKSSGRS